jgi:hypothetical protein
MKLRDTFLLTALILTACQSPRTAPCKSNVMRHYEAELGFSYGEQYERARLTGATNINQFTIEQLRKTIDSLNPSCNAR